MTEFKHTPPPWVADWAGNGQVILKDAKGNDVAYMELNSDHDSANTHLISAAPEMLQEMIDLAKALEDTDHEPPQSFYDAIAKARGES